ncbi:MAG: crossover junction endodeoxyribonuclease RuvC [Candidatus Paceibacterota bacterium]
MRIISLDPGYDRLGIAVIEKDARGKEVLLFSTCHTTEKTEPFENRLFSVVRAFREMLEIYKPDECALEKLFFQNNQKTAMFVSRVIGALTYVSLEKNVPVFEYTPLQIKTAVTGNGRSTKLEMMKMIPLIIPCPKIATGEKMLDDEFDAIAVGVTHLAMRRSFSGR